MSPIALPPPCFIAPRIYVQPVIASPPAYFNIRHAAWILVEGRDYRIIYGFLKKKLAEGFVTYWHVFVVTPPVKGSARGGEIVRGLQGGYLILFCCVFVGDAI